MITTKRLILRPWKEADLKPFAKLNGDPRVMEFFPAVLTEEESNRMVHRLQSIIEELGWGLWAVSVPGVADFIGFIGLHKIDFSAHFTPAVEIGWRLDFEHWGKGYATEGAKAVLEFGFDKAGLDEIVSITTVSNTRSRGVMEKIGLHRDPKDDFDHPKLCEGHSLRRHVLYRLRKEEL